jgi:hypothetical protein
LLGRREGKASGFALVNDWVVTHSPASFNLEHNNAAGVTKPQLPNLFKQEDRKTREDEILPALAELPVRRDRSASFTR